MTARGDSARLGWDLPPIGPVPVGRTAGIDLIFSAPHISPPPTGIVLYRRTPTPQPKPAPVPQPQEQPQEQPESNMDKFRDWLHENIKMPNPEDNPFKLPGLPGPIVVPIMP
jgi:hypothetical protein